MIKKRVLIVVNYFYPYVSGVSEYARATAKALAKHHDVIVLTGKHSPELPDEEHEDGYLVLRAKALFFLDKGYISPAFVKMFKKLAEKSDVVNLHLPMLESGLLSLLTDRPVLVTYQCDMATVGNLLSRIAVIGVRLSMRLALSRATSIVTLSKEYALTSPFISQYTTKLYEIAPPNRFGDEELGYLQPIQNGNTVCGFVGRFVYEKGIETIVEAARILSNKPFEFWLAGNYKDVAGGSVFKQLEGGIAALGGKVRLLGSLSDADLMDFYRSIDVLMLPSTNRFEAFGMVQMEAMTFGATVVTSDMPGVRETVRRTKIGQLCDPGSGLSLANALERAKVERSNVTRQDVRASVLREFGNQKFVADYLGLIDQLCNKQ